MDLRSLLPTPASGAGGVPPRAAVQRAAGGVALPTPRPYASFSSSSSFSSETRPPRGGAATTPAHRSSEEAQAGNGGGGGGGGKSSGKRSREWTLGETRVKYVLSELVAQDSSEAPEAPPPPPPFADVVRDSLRRPPDGLVDDL
eukprot:1187639-Prorocentrum_minimum.AAC.7